MTLEECKARLAEIRAQQGTFKPRVKVIFRGATFQGLLVYSDSDVPHPSGSPQFGVLVLESPGLVPTPPTLVQIASLKPEGIQGL